jgi:thermolysin
VGLGHGYHGELYKFPVTFQSGQYLLCDESVARPVDQYTADYRTYDGHYYYVAGDADNFWDSDGALVSAHTFLGLIYDYYYLFHGREGIDDSNLDIIATVHWSDGSDNAFWDPDEDGMFFLDPGGVGFQFAAALDVVAHEYSHGVTDYTSDLVYLSESGALNESFSDIMGTAVEFYWQEPGSGFLKADWYCGEDARTYFSGSGLRNLADPNSNSQLGDPDYPDPCHLSQAYDWPWYIDNGGVHINSTLYSHAYYLLANGGTNRVSGKSVTAIGMDKATKIFYRAWTYYMVPSSDFLYAANALLQSAYDLYGSSSSEYAESIRAMEAIGWIVT